MKNDSGFSLTEVIIVIAIVTILAAIAIPNFVAWVPKYRLKGAAQDLYSNLQMAKVEAIKRNTDCTVTFSAGQYVVGLVNKTVALEDGVQLATSPGGSPPALTFNSRGFADSLRTVTLSSAKTPNPITVRILTSGVVTIN